MGGRENGEPRLSRDELSLFEAVQDKIITYEDYIMMMGNISEYRENGVIEELRKEIYRRRGKVQQMIGEAKVQEEGLRGGLDEVERGSNSIYVVLQAQINRLKEGWNDIDWRNERSEN